MEQPVDDKGDIRDRLDLTQADWKQVGTGADVIEWAKVVHEGDPYYVLRGPNHDGETVVLVYDQGEWDAFVAGVKDGEFD